MAWRGRRADWSLVLIWIAIDAAGLLAAVWLAETTFLFGLLLQLIWAVIGGGLLLLLLARAGLGPAVVLAVAAFGLALSPLPQWGAWVWFRLSFERNKNVYERIVAHSVSLPGRGNALGAPYEIDRGPPVRVAFPQPIGLVDRWSAVIHDPTGAVLTARRWEPSNEFTVRTDLKEPEGGDLLSCTRITGHWHRCWFT